MCIKHSGTLIHLILFFFIKTTDSNLKDAVFSFLSIWCLYTLPVFSVVSITKFLSSNLNNCFTFEKNLEHFFSFRRHFYWPIQKTVRDGWILKVKNPAMCLETGRRGYFSLSFLPWRLGLRLPLPVVLTHLSPVHSEVAPIPTHLSESSSVVTGIFEFLAHWTEEV
jgi:hypothetical protein